MSFGVGLGDLVLIIQGCIKVYHKIKDADDKIEDVSDRLEVVLNYVQSVDRQLNDAYGPAKNYPQADGIRKLVENMKGDARSIESIFKHYGEIQKTSAVTGWAQQLLYAAGSSTRQLEDLITRLEKRSASLGLSVSQMNFHFLQKQFSGGNPPIPAPKKKGGINILFVDPRNSGRSVVAQAYALLVGEWTTRTGGQWPINLVHSAGLEVKDKAGLMEARNQLKTNWVDGGKHPTAVSMSSLFDNKLFNYPYKATIRERITQQTSRGLGNTSFSNYDYIFVFTLTHLTEMQKLKMLVRKKYGAKLAPKGKARLVLLGEYGDHSNKQSPSIWNPKEDQNGKQSKDGWNICTSLIKISFKGWLKEELDWKEPPKGAPQH